MYNGWFISLIILTKSASDTSAMLNPLGLLACGFVSNAFRY